MGGRDTEASGRALKGPPETPRQSIDNGKDRYRKMIYNFNADAIFEMAEQIERNGARFYHAAARRVPSPAIKAMLIRLAEMEEAHEKTFAALRKELTKPERSPAFLELDADVQKYLTALSDTRIFPRDKKPDLKITEAHTEENILEEIYRSAIRAEKDSIVFYAGVRELVPVTFGKSKVDAIIKEEMQHITTLSIELAALKS
jgi:rubrerythrin